ncbi:MAG: hypothetical protein U1A78_19800 [Polyangia bacterium]
MDNLDILIGFFLIMLVFASGVSVAQSVLKRMLSLKGEAVVRPLLAELEAAWRAQGPLAEDRAAWDQLKAQLRRDLTSWRSDLARQLIYASLKNRSEVLSALRAWGQDKLHAAAAAPEKPGKGAAAPEIPGELAAAWEQAIVTLEQSWDQMAARLSGSYERHTQFWVFALSAAVVAIFHVDSIRIVRVLSVQPEVRRSAVELAQRRAQQQQAAKPTEDDVQPTLTSWQRDNIEDLRSAGLPLGWETAPLVVCGKAEKRHVSLSRTCANGDRNLPETFLLWLVRLIGLLISVGLIAQGAPFWYSLLDSALGARKKVLAITERSDLVPDPGSPPPVT